MMRPTSRRLLRRGPLLIWLVVLWVALWGDVSVANVLGGLAAALVVLLVLPLPLPRAGRTTAARPAAVALFALVFVRELVSASLGVAKLTLAPAGSRRSAVVAFDVGDDSPVVVTLVANAISLTPGTLTLEVDGSTLYVHLLWTGSRDDALAGMRRIEQAAVRAFAAPSREQVRS